MQNIPNKNNKNNAQEFLSIKYILSVKFTLSIRNKFSNAQES